MTLKRGKLEKKNYFINNKKSTDVKNLKQAKICAG